MFIVNEARHKVTNAEVSPVIILTAHAVNKRQTPQKDHKVSVVTVADFDEMVKRRKLAGKCFNQLIRKYERQHVATIVGTERSRCVPPIGIEFLIVKFIYHVLVSMDRQGV